ncbi:MAG: hypothetical protein WC806_05395 [Candidatus Gracilibacteria bacterium]
MMDKNSEKFNEFMSDENLFKLCRLYGEKARMWRQKFIGLLPEVYKRRLFEKKGFSSIFEFAKKLCGLSEEQVRLVLNLEKRFEKMDVLKGLLVEGKVSVNKLSRIASIAKPENEVFLAGQVQMLSKSAVESLVRDEKIYEKENRKNDSKNEVENVNFENQNGLRKSFFEDKSLPEHFQNRDNNLELSPEVREKLFELQQKGIDINNLLLEFLQKREEKIIEKKKEIREKVLQKEQEKPATKHVPIVVRRIIELEYGKKCSIKNCQKQAIHIHHLQRFSVSQSHDPNYLVPLCKEHHERMHAVDLAYCEIRRRVLGYYE